MDERHTAGPGDSGGSAPLAGRLHTHSSTLVEKSLEYTFLSGLTTELLRRGIAFDILRADFDRGGYDVVVEANGTMRHIQLKAMKANGSRREISVNIDLAAKASGCVIWMLYDPATFEIIAYRWFGSAAGGALPHPGERIARHSRANSEGVKAERPQHRIVPASRFETLTSMAEVADRLFAGSLDLLRRHLLKSKPDPDEPDWAGDVRSGRFDMIPRDLDWNASLPLAALIDGYALAEEMGIADAFDFERHQREAAEAGGSWRGGAARLWTTLFLEHRRWRFSAPFEPDPGAVRLLDRLVRQLREALTGEIIQ